MAIYRDSNGELIAVPDWLHAKRPMEPVPLMLDPDATSRDDAPSSASPRIVRAPGMAPVLMPDGMILSGRSAREIEAALDRWSDSGCDANPNRNEPWTAPKTVAEIEEDRRLRFEGGSPGCDTTAPLASDHPSGPGLDSIMPLPDPDDEKAWTMLFGDTREATR